MLSSKRAALCAGIMAFAGTAASADVLSDWNEMYKDAVRISGGGPGPLSRAAAMYSTAMYDAYMNVVRTHDRYAVSVPPNANTNTDAAMSVAAHAALSDAFPALSGMFDTQLATNLAAIPNGVAKTRGIALGTTVGAGCVANRAGDNYAALATMPYAEGGNVGDYKSTPPDNTTPPHGAGWGTIQSWSLASNDQFRPTRFSGMTMQDIMESAEYAAQLNEVKDLGKLVSPSRTADQTESAFFWANDVNGTYKPPGHLIDITEQVAAQQGLSFADRVRLHGLVGLAMGDAAVVAWDAKYETPIDLWRPITGIREADTDNNAATAQDAAWEPLNPFTPPFPAYISGHATFGAAHAAVMASFFGTDNISFDITSEDPFYAAMFGVDPVPSRHFDSFSDAAYENWRSRIYLGVHWDWDGEDANIAGTGLGNWISDNFLQVVPAPGAGMLLTAGLAGFAARRRRA